MDHDVYDGDGYEGADASGVYNGMAATSVESSITARMERGTGMAAGTVRQESRSLLGVSIIRNYFADDVDWGTVPVPTSSTLASASASPKDSTNALVAA